MGPIDEAARPGWWGSLGDDLRALAAKRGGTGERGGICQSLAKNGDFCQSLANPENGPRENLPRFGKKGAFLPSLGKTGRARAGEVFGTAGKYLLAAFPLLVAASTATEGVRRLLGAEKAGAAAAERVLAASGWHFAFLLVAVLAAAPLLEELVFRRGLMRWMVRRAGPWGGLFGSAAVFALCHGQWQAVPPIFVLGVALGAGYARTKSLWTPVAMHAAYNGIALLTAFLLARR